MKYFLGVEPSGGSYEQLIEDAQASCSLFALTLRDPRLYSPHVRSVWESLQKWAAPSDETMIARPSLTAVLGAVDDLGLFRLERKSAAFLRGAVQRLFDWGQPDWPDDLCFVRDDGSLWLSTISHEFDAVIDLGTEQSELAGVAGYERLRPIPMEPRFPQDWGTSKCQLTYVVRGARTARSLFDDLLDTALLCCSGIALLRNPDMRPSVVSDALVRALGIPSNIPSHSDEFVEGHAGSTAVEHFQYNVRTAAVLRGRDWDGWRVSDGTGLALLRSDAAPWLIVPNGSDRPVLRLTSEELGIVKQRLPGLSLSLESSS